MEMAQSLMEILTRPSLEPVFQNILSDLPSVWTTKDFDLMAFAQGVAGNKIFQGLRRLDILTSNYSTKALGRWTGEGTSTTFPRLTDSDPNGNFGKMSDFYLENGDYLRFKVVQLGYTLPNRLFRNMAFQD